MRMSRFIGWALIVMCLATPWHQARAQTRAIEAFSVHPHLGFTLGYLGELERPATLSNSGFGVGANYRQPLDRFGVFGLRLDAGYASLGASEVSVTENAGGLGQSPTKVEISHQLLSLGVGLQLQSPRGILRPYASVGAGISRFITSLTVTRQWNYGGPADSSGMSDNSLTYFGSGGILLMLSSREKPIFLDVGIQAFRAGEFQAQLIENVGLNSLGGLYIPQSRLPQVMRYNAFIGVTFPLH